MSLLRKTGEGYIYSQDKMVRSQGDIWVLICMDSMV